MQCMRILLASAALTAGMLTSVHAGTPQGTANSGIAAQGQLQVSGGSITVPCPAPRVYSTPWRTSTTRWSMCD